ncbi:hypothetical protein QSJ18_00655 [Gordonia sp. ABSL1-1]|uniref:hypothetical protein n=1 Tax=Gordonia sp. ABSL1-1 TaxID=3053923 RepID=UPI0025732F96|nr:hypothetical protein [Gordonia sp. ABSL1-1]MDL9935245.1 hypothetical protein [Gordonia sp. ABSL1-1]
MPTIDDPLTDGQLALFLLFLSFVITFVVTRVITRLIRAGRGPFRDNVSDGLHIHHAVPGIILTVAGAFLSVAASGGSPAAEISAVMLGIGTSLVLDEFALILHLKDVYWSHEGQLSVQVVALTIAALGMAMLGFDPLTDTTVALGPLVLTANLPIHIFCVLMCVAKGKFATAVVGAFVPPLVWVGAIRLARPGSLWARRRYSPDRMETARRRAEHFDRRWGRWGLSAEEWVAGKPSDPTHADPGPTAGAGAE